MPEYGISKSGASAEEEFCRITGATKSPSSKAGDAILNGNLIEVKMATKGQLNQVRACKYIPLVAFDAPANTWYVVPAPNVVALASRKKRGHHGENPFETSTLSIRNLDDFEIATESDLAAAVVDAIAKGKKFPKIEAAMMKILENVKQLASDSLVEVQELLVRDGF